MNSIKRDLKILKQKICYLMLPFLFKMVFVQSPSNDEFAIKCSNCKKLIDPSLGLDVDGDILYGVTRFGSKLKKIIITQLGKRARFDVFPSNFYTDELCKQIRKVANFPIFHDKRFTNITISFPTTNNDDEIVVESIVKLNKGK